MYKIKTPAHLSNIRDYLSLSDVHFILENDIDLNVAPYNEGEVWVPIGSSNIEAFKGHFNGNGKTIRNLFIERSDTIIPVIENTGLFGYVDSGTIKNLILEGVQVRGGHYTGALTGQLIEGNISNIIVKSGEVRGGYFVGGLIGFNNAGTVLNSHVISFSVRGNSPVGGLIGFNQGVIEKSSVTNGSTVVGTVFVRGIAGKVRDGIIINSYSTSEVKGKNYVGGLVGQLLDNLPSNAKISNSYSTGAVSFTDQAPSFIGGFVGENFGGSIISSYYDSITSGQNDDNGKGVPMTTADMMKQDTYVGWDFINVWEIDEGNSYPTLRNVNQ